MDGDLRGRIGVFSPVEELQDHLEALRSIGTDPVEVRAPSDLEGLDGLIVSGRDSVFIGTDLVESGMTDVIRSFFYTGGAVWGIDAGMVLAASTTLGERQPLLGLMNAMVERDGFGDENHEVEIYVEGFDSPFDSDLNHAPYFEMIGPGVETIAEYDGKIVAARGEGILVTAFHPEPGDDVRFYRYFIEEVCRT